MAAPQLITRTNFGPLLKRSTQGRAGTPDGNIYFDVANDFIEIITVTENPLINFGSGDEANPLTNTDKIESLAIYFFWLQELELDPTLQSFRNAMDAVANRMGKLVGATAFQGGIKLATGGDLGDDRLKLANSGFTEFAAAGGGNTLIDRIYHGYKSTDLVGKDKIQPASQPFFMIVDSLSEADRQAATPVDFSKPGSVNEAIQSFGDTANGDTGATDFDSRQKILIGGVRTFGYTLGQTVSTDIGVTELGPYSQGYPLGEVLVQELVGINEADVFGGAAIAPYDGLAFTRLAAAQNETGFTEGDALFTDRITFTGATITRVQLRAFLDALSASDNDENVNTATTGPYRPKRAEPFYTIEGTKMVFRQGLFVEKLDPADEQDVIFTADDGSTRTRIKVSSGKILLSKSWGEDTKPHFRMMFADGAGGLDFDTVNAVTVPDASATDIAGDNTDPRITPVGDEFEVNFTYPYGTDTSAGLSAGVDKNVVVEAGGIDKTKRRVVTGTLTDSNSILIDARGDAETN